MCLLMMAYKCRRDYPLIIAANRDEFFERPTAVLDFWPEHKDILAGRDLRGGGTWMGLHTGGRLAAITNFREPDRFRPEAPSRGPLVSDFIAGRVAVDDYLADLHRNGQCYNGFNLVVGRVAALFYYSNRGPGPQPIAPGIHGLSNHLLDTPWPKVALGKKKLEEVIDKGTIDPEQLFNLLSDTRPAEEDQLPSTGIAPKLEKQLSPIFIKMNGYGTRCSTSLLINRERQVSFSEITFDENEKITQKHFYSFSLLK